jgi:hypothetical protein
MAGGASAQVITPPNCHWVATPQEASVVELWCRSEDGRARPTGKTLRQPAGDAWDGCPPGKLYDGARCVSEAMALAAASRTYDFAPQGYAAGPPPPAQPRLLLFQDRRGGRSRGLACIDQDNVTVCRPIPRH